MKFPFTFQRFAVLSLFAFACCAVTVQAQTAAFTYQGALTDNSAAANGTYEMQFTLHSAASGTGDQVGSTITNSNVQVTSGVFSVELDFGSEFSGADRWLEISVKKSSETSYTTISPRMKLNSVPYATRTLSATAADSLSAACAGCVTDLHINSVSGSKITGNVANADNASIATTATNATNFSGSLTGDVTGTQTATTVSKVGGISASNVASGATAANNATNANTASALVKRDASGNFSAGTITATLNGNAATATTANTVSTSAGDSVVTAINAGSLTINTAHVSGDVELLSSTTQAATQSSGATGALIDVKLVGSDNLGTSGTSDLLSLRASGTYNLYTGGTPEVRNQERFRFDNTGGFAAFGDQDIGSIPAEGAGTRFMWMPYKAATRGGYVNGTQWDDANIGYYSTAFGYNARASGDYAFAAGRESVAANIDSIALGNYITASGAACVALGYYAHCNTRQGSFVFSDRSVVDDGNFATDESFKASVNHSFNVRATGGLGFFTNTAVNTGLRLSHLLSSNTAYGSFVWTDRSSDTAVTPTAQNQTIFRSSGGYWLYSNSGLTAGVTLAPGSGSWTNLSDRNMKENFKAVNSRDILRKVLNLPITTWNYTTQNASIRHIGAMSQDFKAAFGVGEDDKHISTIDPDGVALAAIQGLNDELKEDLKTRDAKIEQQQQQLYGLQEQVKQQQSLIEGMRKLLCSQNQGAEVCRERQN
jgi:hypothetical protein